MLRENNGPRPDGRGRGTRAEVGFAGPRGVDGIRRVGGGRRSGSLAGDLSRYCRKLIETNRDRLVDPDNPDLLVPGQVLTIPPP